MRQGIPDHNWVEIKEGNYGVGNHDDVIGNQQSAACRKYSSPGNQGSYRPDGTGTAGQSQRLVLLEIQLVHICILKLE